MKVDRKPPDTSARRNVGLRVIIVLVAIGLATRGAGVTSEPSTVVDFYVRLPSEYFEGAQSRRERMRWLKGPYNTVDVKNGYLRMAGDGAQQDITVCLFKRSDNSYVIAVGSNEHEVFDPYLDFYRYNGGKWRKVTRQILPVRWNRNWNYVLPRYGRIIHVLNKSHLKVYDLAWRGNAFHVERFARSGPKARRMKPHGQSPKFRSR